MPPRPAGTRPTLSLVAETAGTSVPTVSKVLRGGTYSNQSKATEPSVAYMPMTRPVKPAATSVDR